MDKINPDTTNTLFQLAAQLVNQTGRNIFLTGKAGTGKTTFLKYLRENCPKQMVVLAPTGVAAINAGGVTLHSFLQLPFAPFVPEAKGFAGNEDVVNRQNLVGRLRFNSEKRKLLQQLELLVIDEVSMVRCDVMDAVDTVLRSVRRRPLEKFGGVQVLFIGDMFQLPPVVKEDDWKILSVFYNSPYFFDSQVIREELPLCIEFDKVYRQNEARFIGVLNQVRHNELDAEGAEILESRYMPGFRHSRDDGYIILTTHNENARQINMAELNRLNSAEVSYEAEIEGDFPENAFPADNMLKLKTGAQVMFIRNDTAEKGKRFFNGRIGLVNRLEKDKIVVQCSGGENGSGELPAEIEVTREKWENIRYTLHKNAQTVEEDVLGSFSQFPLRLAWAITIHKSQGLTFSKAIIDAGEAFAPGQVYVALSRCSSLSGMVLKSRLRSRTLFTDPRILQFAENCRSAAQLQKELQMAKEAYRQKLQNEAFDFRVLLLKGKDLEKYLAENREAFNGDYGDWRSAWLGALAPLEETGYKFRQWLQEKTAIETEENKRIILDKTDKAVLHFTGETEKIMTLLQQSPVRSDNRNQAKEFTDMLKDIFLDLARRKFRLAGLGTGFDSEAWHRRMKEFSAPSFSVSAYAGTATENGRSPHPILMQQLKKLRDSLCLRSDLPIYFVAGTRTLNEMTQYLPQTREEIRKISGFGDTKTEKYGEQFLEIIRSYCGENNLSSLVHEKPEKKERKQKKEPARKKGETYAETLRMYREGMSVADIAARRRLSPLTIESHLARYITKGEIQLEDLVSPRKIALIRSALEDYPGGVITPVKEKLGNGISYGEIRMVIAGMGVVPDKSPD